MLLFSKGTLNSLKFCLSCSENQFPTSSVMLLKTHKKMSYLSSMVHLEIFMQFHWNPGVTRKLEFREINIVGHEGRFISLIYPFSFSVI